MLLLFTSVFFVTSLRVQPHDLLLDRVGIEVTWKVN